MPELPETETIARDLDGEITGSRITGVVVTHADVLRDITEHQLGSRVAGAGITRCWRRAKLVVLDLSTGDRLVIQPRFTGALLIDSGNLPERERRYSTLAFSLDDGRALHYRDIRRLGTVALKSPDQWTSYSDALGPEPLDASFSPAHLSGLVRGSKRAVKRLLMDQRRVAGIGNIYANEALWRAGLDPSREGRTLAPAEIERLYGALTAVLRDAIAARGTSFRDYRDAAGERGTFASQLAAYGRGRLPCHRCGRRLIATDAIDGRSTVFCAHCQH